MQAVLPGPAGYGIPVLPEPEARGYGRDISPGQRPQSDLLRPGDAPRPTPPGGTYITKQPASFEIKEPQTTNWSMAPFSNNNYLLLLALLHLQQSVCKLLASVFPPLDIGIM